MNTRVVASLLLGTTFLATPARAQDLFGRSEPRYDLTGDARIQRWMDYAYINGEVPTYAERKGLAGLPVVEVRRNFLYVEDADGSLNIPWQSQDDLFESFNFAVRELYEVFPDEFIFIYLFTSFRTGVGAFFYSPEANTDRGIGSQRFDQNGFSIRQGFVFMNHWLSFEESFAGAPQVVIDAQARSVFNQEAGHRWASFVPVGGEGGGAGPDIMLGRDDGHWSYFMETGGSPMEGNAWRDNGNGTFTTLTSFDNWHFSDLDLYLMGVLPGADVDTWFVITNPDTNGQTDVFGQNINRSSPPQIVQPVTISGTRVDISIEDLQAVHGLRDPPAGTAPNQWRVVFLMLAGQNSALNESEKVEFEEMVDGYALGFSQGARGLASLDYLLMADPKSPIGGPCATVDDCDQLQANLCLPSVGNPPVGLCTRACSSPSSCPTDYCCQEFESGGSPLCLPTAMCTPVCACDLDDAACDPGCDCDLACVNTCACDTSDSCEAGCNCDADCAGVCICDTTQGCEADCACDPGCGGTCTCDDTLGCDPDETGAGACACDPECQSYACDMTFACDDSCACDPECKQLVGGGGREPRGGCGCTAVETYGAPWVSLLLVSLLGIAFTRRRP
jgi:MYXO-CTERM domain-containing protein